jgi:hypothetical protein
MHVRSQDLVSPFPSSFFKRVDFSAKKGHAVIVQLYGVLKQPELVRVTRTHVWQSCVEPLSGGQNLWARGIQMPRKGCNDYTL